MKRRDILKYTALATGAAIAAPLMTTLMSGCKTDPASVLPDYKPSFFSESEFGILNTLIDLILPKTDSPSATEVGVGPIIDNMVGKVYKEEARTGYKKGFQALLAHLKTDGKKIDLQSLQQIMDSKEEALKTVKDAFLHLRQQTVAYYLSTEEIGKNYLNYLPIPGEYNPCIQLSEVGGKAWAI